MGGHQRRTWGGPVFGSARIPFPLTPSLSRGARAAPRTLCQKRPVQTTGVAALRSPRGSGTSRSLELLQRALGSEGMTDRMGHEIRQIEEGDAWDENAEVVQVDVRKPLDTVVPVRLTSASWEQLRQEAKRVRVGPSALARTWILERLRRATDSASGDAQSRDRGR